MRQSCFCDPNTLKPVRVEVRGGQIARVVKVETGDTVPTIERYAYTDIDGLFDRLEAYVMVDDAEFSASYDPAFHYPVEASGSIRNAAYSGFTYTLSEFAVRS
jgi:hypothetical protein